MGKRKWTEIEEDDLQFVLKKVKLNGLNIRFASNRLRNHYQVAKHAVESSSSNRRSALFYASLEMQNNMDILKAAVKTDYRQFKFAGELCKNNKKNVLAIVQISGLCLQYVPEPLRYDKDIVYTAVCKNGKALQFAGKYASNRRIVRAALKNNPSALRYASDCLKSDDRIVKEVLFHYNEIRLASHSKHAIPFFPFKYASPTIKNNRDIVLLAIKISPIAYIFASQRLKKCTEIIKAAVSLSGGIINNVPNLYLKKQSELREIFLCAVTSRSTTGTELAHPAVLKNNIIDDEELILSAVKKDLRAFQFASQRLKSCPAIALEVVKRSRNNRSQLRYIDNSLANCIHFSRAAIKCNVHYFNYMPAYHHIDLVVAITAIKKNHASFNPFALMNINSPLFFFCCNFEFNGKIISPTSWLKLNNSTHTKHYFPTLKGLAMKSIFWSLLKNHKPSEKKSIVKLNSMIQQCGSYTSPWEIKHPISPSYNSKVCGAKLLQNSGLLFETSQSFKNRIQSLSILSWDIKIALSHFAHELVAYYFIKSKLCKKTAVTNVYDIRKSMFFIQTRDALLDNWKMPKFSTPAYVTIERMQDILLRMPHSSTESDRKAFEQLTQ